MRKWRRWRQLSHWERRVVLTLAWQLPRYRLLLRLVPLERLLLPAATSARAALPPRWTSAAFARRCEQLAAIVVANASVDGACLPKSLALRQLLAAYGVRTELKIGVQAAAKPLLAHAWLEHEGIALDAMADDYHAFESLPAAPESATNPR